MQNINPNLTRADNAAAGPQASSNKPKLLRSRKLFRPLLCAAALAAQLLTPSGVFASPTLADLRKDTGLTPERFMTLFADFKFELGRSLQSAETFLERQSGDCDDFATLADSVLREKGYNTRLVVVYMEREAHVVCYVAEAGAYLDYNRRKESSPLVKCEPGLAAIGASVAQSFRAHWRSASEFTYVKGERNFVLTEFK